MTTSVPPGITSEVSTSLQPCATLFESEWQVHGKSIIGILIGKNKPRSELLKDGGKKFFTLKEVKIYYGIESN